MVDGDTLYVGERDVSLTVIVELVATTGPEVEPVLICKLNNSAPSVVVSFRKVLIIVVELFVVKNDELESRSVKSVFDTLPPVVQYNVVEFGTLVVVNVNVTEDPSLTDVVFSVIV